MKNNHQSEICGKLRPKSQFFIEILGVGGSFLYFFFNLIIYFGKDNAQKFQMSDFARKLTLYFIHKATPDTSIMYLMLYSEREFSRLIQLQLTVSRP